MKINSLNDILNINDNETMLSNEVFDYLVALDTINFEKSVLAVKDYMKKNKKTFGGVKMFNALLKEKKEEIERQKEVKKSEMTVYEVQIPETNEICSFKMKNYYIDEENNQIVEKMPNSKVDKVICNSLIFPYAIISDIENNTKLVDIVYLDTDFNWKVIREDICAITSHSTLCTRIGKVFLGITSNNSKKLIDFFQELITLNPKMFIPKKSASHFGWLNEKYVEDDIFIPYGGVCEFSKEGDDAKRIFNSLKAPAGSFDTWQQITEKLRKNIPMRLSLDVSIASPLLHILGLDSFTFLLHGGSELGKSKCQTAAMTVWGNPDGETGLKFPMKATENYIGILAGILKNIPVCVDELKAYTGDISILPYNHSLNKDKGRATISKQTNSIITQKGKTWRTPLIISGELPIMTRSTDAGALNRLLEIEVKEKTMEDFHGDTPILLNNYGWAGEKIIDYIKTIPKKDWLKKLWEIQEYIVENVNTTEKQANLMAVVLLGDLIARELFYKNEKPLNIDDYADFLYSKEDVSLGIRAYKEIIGLVSSHQDKFYVENPSGFTPPSGREFWGEINDGQIKILRSQVVKLLKSDFDKDCSPDQIIGEWKILGYLQLTTAKKPKAIHQTTVQKRKGDYLWINIIGDYDDGLKEEGKILSIEAHKQREQQLKDIQTKHLNEITQNDKKYDDYFINVGKKENK